MKEQPESQLQAEPQMQSGAKIPITPVMLLSGALVLLVVAGIAFYAGVQYQKGQVKSMRPNLTRNQSGDGFGGGPGAGGQFGMGQRPILGTVTAISPSSITIDDSRAGGSTTLKITTSTKITNDGQTVTVSDIKSGDTVAITADSSDSTQAARILVNPSLGNRSGGQTPPSDIR